MGEISIHKTLLCESEVIEVFSSIFEFDASYSKFIMELELNQLLLTVGSPNYAAVLVVKHKLIL
jgi:hypothetical protein